MRYMVIARGRITRRGTCRCEGGVDEAEGNVKRHRGVWRAQVVVVMLLERGGIVLLQQCRVLQWIPPRTGDEGAHANLYSQQGDLHGARELAHLQHR